MKKIYSFKFFALTILMFGAFLCNAVAGIDLPFQSNFSGVGGSSESSSSQMPAVTATTMPAGFLFEGSQNIFEGGQKLKLGTSNAATGNAILPTDVINTSGATTIEVKFNAIGWPQTATAKTVQVILTYGTQTQEIIIDGKVGWPVVASDLIEYSCLFTAIAAPTSLIIETTGTTTERRIFLDNVRITASSANIVANPTFSPVAGTYNAPQNVTISCATTGATIRYTTDGTSPTTTSPVYTSPINVSTTTTIKALATKAGMDNSNIATAIYTIVISSGIDLPFQSDFSELPGSSTASTSDMPAITATTMPTGFMFIGSQGIYGAGQKLKFGTSSGVGILPTDVINTNGVTAIEVKFNAIAWPTPAAKTAQVILTYGEQTEEFTVDPTEWPVAADDLIEFTCQFTAITAPTALFFKTTTNSASNESRIFLDNVRIYASTVSPVATPVFSPAQGTYYTPQSVTISCATAGADIHYTTDGTNPTASSPVYTTPINVSTTTTLKAMATKAGYSNSSTATAVYSFPTEVPNIAAFKAANTATSTTVYKITGNVTFVYKTGRYFYIKDATGGLLIYDFATPLITNSYNNGDIISGGVIGTCTIYNGLYQLLPTANLAAGTSGAPVQPITLTMATLLNNFAAYESQLVKLSNVTFDEGTFGTSSSGGNIKIYQDEDSLICRNHFNNITGYVTDPSKHFDVTGFAIPYITSSANDKQIAPRGLEDIKESSAVQLSGTVTIAGSTVFGETLTATANLTSTPTIPDLGAITYQWMRGGNVVGTNSATYTLAQGDVGNKITVTVTTANCSGSVTSAETAVVSKATQTAPAAPTSEFITYHSITLKEISGCEYRMSSGAWQTSTTFDGLTPETTYSFEARKAETATHLASDPGPAAQFKTEPVGVNENELNKIQVYSFRNSVSIKNESNVEVQAVKIFDMTGRLVYQNTINKVETIITLQVPPGIYHVVLQTRDDNKITKVLITK